MAKYGMAIDLDKCVGCGACALACKTENNTQFIENSKKFNWADYLTITSGSFADGDVSFKVIPTLCNHCDDAPCVEICPVTPKAMYKTDTGITMHNDDRCIGCQLCQVYCPYSELDVDNSEAQYTVISYNSDTAPTHPFYSDETAIIQGGTSTPKEIATAVATPPNMHDYTHSDYYAVRPSDVTEKCIFCDHRVQNGDLPYCVDSCPAGARIFGDLEDPTSDVSVAIANGAARLKNNKGEFLGSGETGTSPNVYYLGMASPTGFRKIKNKPSIEQLTIYPNPADDQVSLKFELKEQTNVSIDLYDVRGKLVKSVKNNQLYTVGNNTETILVGDLNAGTYIIRLSYGKKVLTANLLVSR